MGFNLETNSSSRNRSGLRSQSYWRSCDVNRCRVSLRGNRRWDLPRSQSKRCRGDKDSNYQYFHLCNNTRNCHYLLPRCLAQNIRSNSTSQRTRTRREFKYHRYYLTRLQVGHDQTRECSHIINHNRRAENETPRVCLSITCSRHDSRIRIVNGCGSGGTTRDTSDDVCK